MMRGDGTWGVWKGQKAQIGSMLKRSTLYPALFRLFEDSISSCTKVRLNVSFVVYSSVLIVDHQANEVKGRFEVLLGTETYFLPYISHAATGC